MAKNSKELSDEEIKKENKEQWKRPETRDEFVMMLLRMYISNLTEDNFLTWAGAYYDVLREDYDYDKIYQHFLHFWKSTRTMPSPAWISQVGETYKA